MEKRVFLAIALSFLVFAVYQTFFPPPSPPKPAAAASTPASAPAPTTAASTAGSAPGQTPAAAVPAATAPASPAAPPSAVLVSDTSARDIVVETDAVRAVFSTAGATLRSWKLKAYKEAGQPLDLVPSNLPDTYPRPFAMSTDDAAISRTLETALFKPSADGLSLDSKPGTLSFEYREASGLSARKTFYFQPDGKSYVVKVNASIDVGGKVRPVKLAWGPALGLGYSPDGSRSQPARGVIFMAGSRQYLSESALKKQSSYEGTLRYAGVEDQYFLSAALPGAEPVHVDYTPVTLPVEGDAKGRSRTFVSYTLSTPGAMTSRFFMGPKQFDILHDVDPQLVLAIDFGWFSFIVTPLLLALKSINAVLHNYGWSIVGLTVVINLIIFPLRHRSMVSMKKMQAVQPEVKAIQDRYAKYKLTDPERQKMNQEMMALYKQKGVNPASGCLPMLLTLPILYAFYALLQAAIELRDAPFGWWIHDLSKRDPYFITPILMGFTMLWQQRTMPSTADPVQQKMFMLMPVVFTVSFLWAPSGLVIYWFVSNLLAIGQQYLTNRMIAAPVRAPRAARS